MKNSTTICLIILLAVFSCNQNEDITNDTADNMTSEESSVGFEIIEVESPTNIIVWTNNEMMTPEEFEAIQLPSNWIKNQPRELDMDSNLFHRSPDQLVDGEFTTGMYYGYDWLFNAQVTDLNVILQDNSDGLLVGRNVAKYHQVTFNAGKTIYVLVAPDGQEYIRISRDFNRTDDVPLIPATWQIEERVINEDLTIELPNPTLNIRAQNNQDSFQGPIDI